MKTIIFLALCLQSTGLRMRQLSLTTKASKTVSVYVLNMEARKDRCLCMATLLNKAPFTVFKITAATPDTQFELCPKLQGLERGGSATRNRGAQSGLFCSNYLAWQHSVEQPIKSDFTVVLEDDVIFDNAVFWPKLQSFLDSDCEGKLWDLVEVDTLQAKEIGQSYACKDQKERHTITSGLGYGTHVQIFRTSSLPKFLAQTMTHTTDKWSMAPKNVTIRGWNPGMVLQGSQLKKFGQLDQLQTFCDPSTMHSDIDVKGSSNKRNVSFAKTEFAFEC